MLTLLKIENLALIDFLQWEPGAGLISVTGETGAGKSVIIGALKLILGERADKGLIRSGETTCSVEAIFDLEEDRQVNALLLEAGLRECEEKQLIIRRSFSASTNRQFVNNSPATLGILRELSPFLVDLHGPSEPHSLLSLTRQTEFLDKYGSYKELLIEYKRLFDEAKEALRLLREREKEDLISDAQRELLAHQVEEIEAAQLQEGEEEVLEEKGKRIQNATRLWDSASKALACLEEEQGGLMDSLRLLTKYTGELCRWDSALEIKLAPLEEARESLMLVEDELRSYLEELEVEPAEVALIEERLNLTHDLKRKYGASLAEVMEFGQKAKERLTRLESREETLAALAEEEAHKKALLEACAHQLSAKRREQLEPLAQKVQQELRDLGFAQADFQVELLAQESCESWGREQAQFLISPNAGEPLKPLHQIASSGEMARLMLAIKSALAGQDPVPLLVFDEIDANVGGEIARVVGEKLLQLSERHQIISITHFPQVAALSSHHYLVEKKLNAQRTLSSMRMVLGEDRVAELVRMLGGGGDTALAHARAMLQEGEK